MRRSRFTRLVFGAVIAGALAFGAARVHAITYGIVDSTNIFSNVGAFIVQSPSGRISPICTGTLVTPNVFLTASHCTIYFETVLAARGYTAFVSFDPVIPYGTLTSPSTTLLAVASVVTNPAYTWRQDDSGDVGALILAKDMKRLAPAALPACGLLDQLNAQNGLKDAVFTAAGYGVQERVVGDDGTPYFIDVNPVPRKFAFSSFDALAPGYLRLSQNPALGDGGTCYGDSGGPNFLPLNNQLLLAAVTTTGDSACRATNVDYRLDTPGAQWFFDYVNTHYGTTIPTSACQ